MYTVVPRLTIDNYFGQKKTLNENKTKQKRKRKRKEILDPQSREKKEITNYHYKNPQIRLTTAAKVQRYDMKI
ncbi:hypothetical protein DERF_010133 [Dermatophagoides farinae]|uniref:Uncharacterized protein n=1 Tax=Dermatophagoides farinae TaxID=6954 RepID=A0A922HWD7_DERFA|nr:hypothetical protein DERF_010133 [Dermatophagoides farinae]